MRLPRWPDFLFLQNHPHPGYFYTDLVTGTAQDGSHLTLDFAGVLGRGSNLVAAFFGNDQSAVGLQIKMVLAPSTALALQLHWGALQGSFRITLDNPVQRGQVAFLGNSRINA